MYMGARARGPPAAAVACAIVAAALAAAAPLVETAAGHGIGVETIRPLDAAGRDVSIGVEVTEDLDDSAAARLTVTVLDDATKQAVGRAVLEIGVSRGGQELARDRFATADGTLFAVMSPPLPPDAGAAAAVAGARDGGAWSSEPNRPVEIRAPGLGGPGLYTFGIRLVSIDGTRLPGGGPSGRADVSLVEAAEHELAGSDGEAVQFRTRSYFDRVSSIEYDPGAETARLEMPFDWSDDTVAHVPVVHVEIHFPKGLAGFTSPSYTGTANGVGLFKSSVTVDDYTEEDERIVHFVLLGDHLRFVKTRLEGAGPGGGAPPDTMVLTLETSQDSRFPMTAYTPGEELRVDLTWEPPEVAPDKKTNFIFTIRDGATGDPLRRSSYDFVIVQGGKEVHRAAGDAAVGGSFEQFTFSEGQTGPTVIRFEDIRGTGASTEFALVVVPEFSSAALLVLAAAAAAAAVAAPALLRPGLRAPAP